MLTEGLLCARSAADLLCARPSQGMYQLCLSVSSSWQPTPSFQGSGNNVPERSSELVVRLHTAEKCRSWYLNLGLSREPVISYVTDIELAFKSRDGVARGREGDSVSR